MDHLATGAKPRPNPHERILTPAELAEYSAGCRGVLAFPADRIDRAFLAARPEVRIVATFSVGYDHVDTAAARELGVVITNTPDVLTDATADLTLGLILSLLRRLAEGDRLIRAGGFKSIHPLFMLGHDCRGRVLGILGLGRIGRAVARRARAFARTVYHNRHRCPRPRPSWDPLCSFDRAVGQFRRDLHHAPERNRGAFRLASLTRMKRTAYLVNTGRGPIVREADLVTALERGLIAGAALDVYENEPVVHPGLLGREDVVLSPHLGSATWETRTAMGMTAANNLLAFLSGREPPNRVA